MKLFDLFGVINIDDKQAVKGLDNVDKGAGKISNAFKSLGPVIATALSVTAIITFGKKTIELGSWAEEMKNKFDVTFEGMGDTVEDWAEDYSNKVGRSKYDTMEFLSNLADLQQGLGMTKKESFDLSKNIVTLATDLASFNNLTDEQAVQALSKAMLGEAESAKQLGLLLNVDRVKQFAEAQGLVYENLTDSERAMLTYDLAVSQSQNAIGDAERSSQSYANQVKALQTGIKDLTTEFGMKLIPVATSVVQALVKYGLPAFQAMGDAVLSVASSISQFLAPIVEYISGFIKDNFPAIQKTADGFFSKMREGVLAVWGVIQPLLMPIIEGLAYFIRDNFPFMRDTAVQAFGIMTDVVKLLFDWFKTYLVPIIERLYEWIAENYPEIQKIFENVFGAIIPILELVFEVLSEHLLPALGELFTWASEKLGKIGDFFIDIFGKISESIEGAIGWIDDFIDKIVGAIEKVQEFFSAQKKPSAFDLGTGDPYGVGGSGGVTQINNISTKLDSDEVRNVIDTNNYELSYMMGVK